MNDITASILCKSPRLTNQMDDIEFMERAIALALETELQGNLPIGAVITLEHQIIASGANTLLHPRYDPKCHAEMNAMDQVPVDLWHRAKEMTCYTTLEPCCMCFGRILLSGIGKVVFGASDTAGGAGCLLNHLPPFYHTYPVPLWMGPVMPEKCDELFARALVKFNTLGL